MIDLVMAMDMPVSHAVVVFVLVFVKHDLETATEVVGDPAKRRRLGK